MDAATKAALLGSIAKWQAINDGTGHDEGSGNCPLCQMFIKNACIGCPVREKTGRGGCEGSPYDDWAEAHSELESADAANAMLVFLQGLLPQEEAP